MLYPGSFRGFRRGTGPIVSKFSVVIVITLGFLIMGFGFFGTRPSTLNLTINSHVLSPSVKRVLLNGRKVMNHSIGGLREGSSINYLGLLNDNLNFEFHWFDILSQTAYQQSMTLRASELSNFGPGKEHHVSLQIVVGPGPLMTATTSDPKMLAHIGQRGGEGLSNVSSTPVLLRSSCGDKSPLNSINASNLQNFFNGILDGSDSAYYHYQQALVDRQRALERGVHAPNKCL